MCNKIFMAPMLLMYLAIVFSYCICGNFRGMKFLLNRKQISQVHCGKVACYVLLQIYNCCKLANFHGLNFRCIGR